MYRLKVRREKSSVNSKIFRSCSRAGGQVVSEIERLPPREGFRPARKALLDQALQGSSVRRGGCSMIVVVPHRKYSCASPEVFVTLQTAQPLTNRNSVQMRQSNLVECQYVHGRRYQSHPR